MRILFSILKYFFIVLWIIFFNLLLFWWYKYYEFKSLWWLDKLNFFNDNIDKVTQVISLSDDKVAQELSKTTTFVKKTNYLIDDYLNWSWNFLKKNKLEIDYLLSNTELLFNTLSANWLIDLKTYNWFLKFFSEAIQYKSTLYDLLWMNSTKRYIIALQNVNEVRPSWWFFWSTVVLELDWWRYKTTLIDSYWVCKDLKNKWESQSIEVDDWLWEIYYSNKASYIWWNKIWLTNIDWDYISRWYQHCLKQKIDWIFFVKSSILDYILPWMNKQLQEWQFVNAATDIIKEWDVNKKYNIDQKKWIYLKEAWKLLESQMSSIIKRVLKDFTNITQKWYVKVYLRDYTEHPIQSFLDRYWLLNTMQDWYVYFFDTNYAYNKNDWFVDKIITVRDYNTKKEIYNNKNEWQKDRLDTKKIWTWLFEMTISYNFNIPKEYQERMLSLQDKYWIQITDREKHILWINSNANNWQFYVYNYWFILWDKKIRLHSINWEFENIPMWQDWPTNTVQWSPHLNKSVKLPLWNQSLYSFIMKNNPDKRDINIVFSIK